MSDAPTSHLVAIADPREPTIERLLALLEQATEGSADLDDAIMEIVADSPLHMTYRGKYGWQFSRSLDAALTLVPEGWGWLAQNLGNPMATLFGDRKTRVEWAATPALALCIAALKARAALADNPRTGGKVSRDES